MTDKLTQDEIEYYRQRIGDAWDILDPHVPEDSDFFTSPMIAAVFEKIASPLYFLREGAPKQEKPPKVDRVTEQNSGAPKPVTRFKKSKAPDNAGFTEFAREDYVRADLAGVLQYLRIHRDDIKPHKGYIYKLNDFDNRDWLWRKKEASK